MASDIAKLTKGSLKKIQANERVERPVLQIIAYKQMGGGANQTKFRFQMTDGDDQCTNFIVVLPELIQRVERGEFEKFTIVELVAYLMNQQPAVDRQIIIINDMRVVTSGAKVNRRLDKLEPSGLLRDFNQTPETSRRSGTGGDSNRSTNSYANRPTTAPQMSTVGTRNISPIAAITPYFSAWQLMVRVTSKAAKRNWSNAKGEGSVFSFDVIDSSGEIRINAFNKEVDRFYDQIEVGKVYFITKGVIKPANKKFSHLANDYEITLIPESVIEQCVDEVADMPKISFKFIKIRDLVNVAPKTMVDIIGVVKHYDDCVAITSKKTNKELRKRDITIMDNTAHEVRFTIWNDMAEQFDCPLDSIMAIKNALVGDYNGRTLGSVNSTTLHLDPDIAETNLLKDWYAREGQRVQSQSLSRAAGEGRVDEWRLVCQINEQTVKNDNRVYFNLKGRITLTNRTPLYKACGQNNCMRKVQEVNNGIYHCDKCQSDSPNFMWRLILAVSVSDCTGEIWVTLFQEQAEKLVGMSATDLAQLQEDDPQRFLKTLASVEFKQFQFRLGSKMEHYMDENRVKSVAYNFTPIDPIKQSKLLLQKIRKMSQ